MMMEETNEIGLVNCFCVCRGCFFESANMKDLFGNTVEVIPARKRSKSEGFNDYDGFVEKFKPKKTTDDCYTPQPVYDAILGWVRENADIEGREIVRPFYPGGDYENYDYPDGCVVIDNPPFSILSKITRFYTARGIMFFLFAPHLTLFSHRNIEWTCIVCNATITYDNGAKVSTSFFCNLFGDVRIMTAPELHRRIKEADLNHRNVVRLPKYRYPDNVVSSALLGKIAPYVDFCVKASECCQISRLDMQGSKEIFGGGFLISERAAAERAAAERAAEKEAQVWELSEREKAIVATLG